MLRTLVGFACSCAFLLAVGPAVSAPEWQRDVVYDTTGGETLKLDIYKPENNTTSHAVVLLIHAGGWSGGDKNYHSYIGMPLAQKGILAFSANYRLAPKNQYPAGVQDCQTALRWVRAHAADYSGDASRIGLMGESAGGHLSSLLGLMDWSTTAGAEQGAHDGARVRAVVNVFGPSDLTGFENIEFCRNLLKGWFGGTESQMPARYLEASPKSWVTKPGPAFLHLHGTADPLVPVDQTRHFDAQLRAADYTTTAIIYEGASHGWLPDSEIGKKSKAAILEFFERELNAQK
jgi:acetyl esterase/lipase